MSKVRKVVKKKQSPEMTLSKASALLMGRIIDDKTPPDTTLVSAFREAAFSHFSKQDRQRLFDIIYLTLRYRSSLSLMSGNPDFSVMVDYLLKLSENKSNINDSFIEARHTFFQDQKPPSELPDWLEKKLSQQYGAAFSELALSLLAQAPTDIRVNTLKADRKQILQQLDQASIAASPTVYSPWGIRLEERKSLSNHPLFQAGLIEIQDEGSQLISLLLGAKREEWVVDFCAGAGGKTLAIAAMMRSTGRLYALDSSAARLEKIKPRLLRAGLKQVVCQAIEGIADSRLGKLTGKADRVLVDAPCSGLGTLRRNPALKWQYQPEDIAVFAQQQCDILEKASSLVRPGGVLVYATCSILQEENQQVVCDFLKKHADFVREPIEHLPEFSMMSQDIKEDLILLPYKERTDGFYAVRLRRQKG